MTSTTSRLLTLLSLLQSRRDWPGGVLAGRLGISHRTVRRDIERLREMGYRIQSAKGPDGGYRLEAGADLPPLLFDDDQAVALTVALGSAVAAGAQVEEAAVRALTTLRQVMPPRLRHRLEAIRFTTMAPTGAAAGAVSPEVLIAISAAIRDQQTLRFDYSPPGSDDVDRRPARRAEPHHLVARDGRWYLVAWDLERDDWRVFRADRLTPRTPNGPRFVRRRVPGGVRTFLSARFKGSDAADTWPCTGTVILNLPASAVLPFAGDGTVEALGPHRSRLELGSWSWVALVASLGRFDAEIQVEGPAELREAFADVAARYVRAAASTATTEASE